MRRVIGLAAVASLALAPAASAASLYSRMLHVYQTTNTIPACEFTSAQLESVLKSTDTYASQYFADFTNAISGALAQRATGACSPAHAAASSQGAAAAAARNQPLTVSPALAGTGSGLPTPLTLLAMIAGLFLLGATAATVVRVSGWEPAWAGAWRHAWREAEYRLGARWEELLDRVRSRT